MRTAEPKEPEEAPRLDALRRKLYGPDSTVDDVERYRRASGQGRLPPVRAPRVAAPPRARRMDRRRIGLLVGPAALAVLLVLATGFLLGGHRSAPATFSRATVAPAVAAPPPPARERLAVSAWDRDALVRSLDSTDPHPLSTYLYSHPDRGPDELRGVQREQSEEHLGTGPGTVRLDPPASADGGGRVTVILLVDRTVSAGWRAAGTTATAARGAGALAQTVRPIAGIPATATVPSSVPAPTRLAISVPPGVRWSVLVAFTD